ncbi:DUF2690 domain-containing protein [Streptomyces sp. NPDC058741]|uniref:helix-turn-helix domain-containing protein n=1 Tax=Streptomyces sp. NPDC058741 TaxID=3346620 RepID=UPI0036837465
MPRWKALPDELDPQIREFTSQLRRLVDRSGLSIASVADRTGYSKTSWERYLNGRLLAPKGAIVALAEVTGTNPLHVTTMWELAERAWSRSEMRHDMTMEAIRISQARAALGEFGGQDFGAPADGRTSSAGGGSADSAGGGRGARRSGSATVTPGATGPAGVSPAVPAQPTAPEVQDSSGGGVREGGGGEVNSWRLAGYKGPSPAGTGSRPGAGSGTPAGPSRTPDAGTPHNSRTPGAGTPHGSRTPEAGTPHNSRTPEAGTPHGSRTPEAGTPHNCRTPEAGTPHNSRTPGAGSPYGQPQDAVPVPSRGAGGSSTPGGSRGPGGSGGSAAAKRRTVTFAAAVVGVLVVMAGAFHLTGGGAGDEAGGGTASPKPTASKKADLPPGVKCSGDGCTGKDAEAMGCSGDLVTTARTATVGATTVEVRYSETCKAAWGRITQAAQGDEVQISSGKVKQAGSITEAGDAIAYTPMVAVKSAADAKACATLAAGGRGCTE